jgi:hypothetical protein
MSRLFVSSGRSALVVAMVGPDGHSWKSRPQRRASDDPHWRTLPVEGSAHWRRVTAADRRARRVKLLLTLIALLVGVAVALLKGY